MAILTQPLLLKISQHIDTKHSCLRWIDLYAAQYMADAIIVGSDARLSSSSNQQAPQVLQGQTLDLFAEQETATNSGSLALEDMLVLGMMCSYVTSLGQTYLSLERLPMEILQTALLCGYQPTYQTPAQLSQALAELDQPAFLVRVESVDTSFESDPAVTSDPDVLQAPLILYQDRLYLMKYWRLHERLEAWLHSRSDYLKPLPDQIIPALGKMLRALFKLDHNLRSDPSEIDWQALAAAHTLINPFSLITGGPGTGKTTTAASLLSLLIYKSRLEENGHLDIHLLAPTGKAAVRLADSIRAQLLHIETRLADNGIETEGLADSLPTNGQTVHRFLYERGGLRDTFAIHRAFNSDEVLSKRGQQALNTHDNVHASRMEIIIVDESSMIDLALMVELVSLIPGHAQLILLGDHYQLPAVDPGQVFADCVARFSQQQASTKEYAILAELSGFKVQSFAETVTVPPELGFQPLCVLHKTYRFGGDLKLAADAIKQGEFTIFKDNFRAQTGATEHSKQVIWHELSELQHPVFAEMVSGYDAYFMAVSNKADLMTLASCFETYQLLCSTLEGPLGVAALNHFIEQHYYHAWQKHAPTFSNRDAGALYHGKAILVTRNHPHLGIFNGDIGFVIQDEQDGNLTVHFPAANQSVIVVAPARIREWQTAYAMTVHKSQGSEYSRVGVVLADYAKELLTRSLLYTALTRSKEHCSIWATEDALKKAFE